jgi:hypothetical protein
MDVSWFGLRGRICPQRSTRRLVKQTYLVDCYAAFAEEILVAINVIKNLIAFLFAFVAVDWINTQRWIQVYMIMFMVVSLVMVLEVPVYFWGRRASVPRPS